METIKTYQPPERSRYRMVDKLAEYIRTNPSPYSSKSAAKYVYGASGTRNQNNVCSLLKAAKKCGAIEEGIKFDRSTYRKRKSKPVSPVLKRLLVARPAKPVEQPTKCTNCIKLRKVVDLLLA